MFFPVFVACFPFFNGLNICSFKGLDPTAQDLFLLKSFLASDLSHNLVKILTHSIFCLQVLRTIVSPKHSAQTRTLVVKSIRLP